MSPDLAQGRTLTRLWKGEPTCQEAAWPATCLPLQDPGPGRAHRPEPLCLRLARPGLRLAGGGRHTFHGRKHSTHCTLKPKHLRGSLVPTSQVGRLRLHRPQSYSPRNIRSRGHSCPGAAPAQGRLSRLSGCLSIYSRSPAAPQEETATPAQLPAGCPRPHLWPGLRVTHAGSRLTRGARGGWVRLVVSPKGDSRGRGHIHSHSSGPAPRPGLGCCAWTEREPRRECAARPVAPPALG